MHRSQSSLGRLGAAVVSTSIVACLAIVAPASAATSGAVTVIGGSVPTIDLTIPDTDGIFGANLTPDGLGSGGESSGVWVGGPGACYVWDGSTVVKSNVAYGVTLSATAANNRLDVLTANPANYTACTGGWQVANGSTNLVTGQAVTSTRTHHFWLGLDVQWTDAPGSLANDTLTLTAVAGL